MTAWDIGLSQIRHIDVREDLPGKDGINPIGIIKSPAFPARKISGRNVCSARKDSRFYLGNKSPDFFGLRQKRAAGLEVLEALSFKFGHALPTAFLFPFAPLFFPLKSLDQTLAKCRFASNDNIRSDNGQLGLKLSIRAWR